MKVGSLFSGIGGFDLGLERAGFEISWQVEIDPFCNKVLAKHWPDVKRYGDIKNVTNLEPVDLICGGFPCQPFSCAGKRKGKEDDRFLWPEMLRVVSEVKPRWVIGENVAGFIDMGLDDCISDLENQGYEVQTFIIPACALNAPHRRDRVWIVANNKGIGCRSWRPESTGLIGVAGTSWQRLPRHENEPFSSSGEARQERCRRVVDVTDTGNQRLQGGEWGRTTGEKGQPFRYRPERYQWDEPWIEAASRLCALDDGVSVGLARPGRNKNRIQKLKAIGNAVVPQIVTILGNAISSS